MNNTYYIHRSDIKDDEWYLLDSLPKHKTWIKMPLYCSYVVIAANGTLLDTINAPSESICINNLPEFIEKFNEFRLFLLL